MIKDITEELLKEIETRDAIRLLVKDEFRCNTRAQLMDKLGMQDIEPEFAATLHEEFWNLL
jgi:hypothetical protein